MTRWWRLRRPPQDNKRISGLSNDREAFTQPLTCIGYKSHILCNHFFHGPLRIALSRKTFHEACFETQLETSFKNRILCTKLVALTMYFICTNYYLFSSVQTSSKPVLII